MLVEANADRVYRGLYRAAATRWFADGVQVQAITLLSDDQAAREAWFWNGFGLHVVDGMRPMGPIHAPQPAGYRVRKAEVADAEMVAAIEAEHWTHYAKPPVLMMTNAANTAEECAALIRNPENSFWLALGEDAQPAGYMRFEASIDGGAAVLEGEGGVGITGAYVRPAHRGRGLSPALLDAALCDYAARGYLRCAVDFESFNPEAAAFWPKYFQLVTYSLVRIPEREPEKI